MRKFSMPDRKNSYVTFKTDDGCYLAVNSEGQAFLTQDSGPSAIFERIPQGKNKAGVRSLITGNPLHLTNNGEVFATKATQVGEKLNFEVRETRSGRISIQTASGVILKPDKEQLQTEEMVEKKTKAAFHIQGIDEWMNLNGPGAAGDFGVLWESRIHKALVSSAIAIIDKYKDKLPQAKKFCDLWGSDRTFISEVERGALAADTEDPYNDYLWRKHFYDPYTEKNYLGLQNYTAKTECVNYFRQACMENNYFKLGLSFHFFADLHMPMHVGNYTNAHDPWGCHGKYEEYADGNMSSFFLDAQTFRGKFTERDLFFLMDLEKLCWGVAVAARSIFGPLGYKLIPQKAKALNPNWGNEADSSLSSALPLAQKGAVMLFLRWADVMGLSKSPLNGGIGGDSFIDDFTTEKIVKITLHHGGLIDGIQTTWGWPDGQTLTGKFHGGLGGNTQEIKFAPDEYIIAVEGKKCDKFIRQLAFVTNKRRCGPYGNDYGSTFSYSAKKIRGFYGRAGCYVDALGMLAET